MTGRWLVLLACWLVCARVHGQASAGDLRRFALIIGANDGGPARELLQYAERDASAVRAVLEQLGGVESRDVLTLSQPNGRALASAFEAVRARVVEARRAGDRTEVVFYYSGHSDDGGLLLGRERIGYPELRRELDQLEADVRIAILDSCASGAFTRLKGGKRRAPFLFDGSTRVTGHAFLTSSSASEAAQESDRIGGSFFTHYLVSGLRGAADASGDRKITLTEAYRFAFDETLARTAQTKFGSQHPSYEIRLAGTGDLVMTDLRATSAELVLDESVEGRVFAWDAQRVLALEVYKGPRKRLVLALPPGVYRLELAREQQFYEARANAVAGASQTVGAAAFRPVEREATLARGLDDGYDVRPFSASVVPSIATNPQRRERPILNYVGVALLYDDPDALHGLQLGLIGVGARGEVVGMQYANVFTDAGSLHGLQLSLGFNAVRYVASGLQLSGAVNYAGQTALAIQLAGAANYAGELGGAQLAFGFNYTSRRARAIQLGAVNYARELGGLQLGGLNVVSDGAGVQLGGVNTAAGRVRGMQVGLLNYADEADVSLAPLGITRRGGAHPQVAFSDIHAPDISLRVEANYNYTFVSFGISPYRGELHRAFTLGFGLGMKIPLYRPYAWLDIDLAMHVVQPMVDWYKGLPNTLYQLRVLPRVQLHDHFSIFAGLTLNALLQLEPLQRTTPGLLRGDNVAKDEEARILLWPGFACGVRL